MSNSSSEQQPGPPGNDAEVFARLADVPLAAMDELIERIRSAYGDLNRLQGHPYWGDLVLHQGAALRALGEARDCLDQFRAEAVGARNTELGITVLTAVIAGERRFAMTASQKSALIDQVLKPEEPERARMLFLWDRPLESDDGVQPYEQIRLVTSGEAELGALNFVSETDDGELRSWQTRNGKPSDVRLRFDLGSPLTFPADSALPLTELRTALEEFAETGQRPDRVQWQSARWVS